jgi:leucyl-tRNA synthetase
MEPNFRTIEKKWQQRWKDEKRYKTEIDSSRPKYYVLDMFPYPSGAGLHVGHPLGYIASDIVSRYKRLKGFNVLHPMGFDAFGLPAEQYAIQTGRHPADTTAENITRYKEQLGNIGFCYDWDREVITSDPGYHTWTQWIFLQLFGCWFNLKSQKADDISTLENLFAQGGSTAAKGACGEHAPFSAAEWNAMNEADQRGILMQYRLAYQDYSTVNWCEALGTVLANDEVKDGLSERGGHPVEKRRMRQWFLRITAYAERLLNDLETLEWTDSMKEMQRNWIGRSEGASIRFEVASDDLTPSPSESQRDQYAAETRTDSGLNSTSLDLTPNPSPRERGTDSGFVSEPGVEYHLANSSQWKLLIPRAKEIRSNMTASEKALWEALRNSAIGLKFRRQHIINQFIVDFVCLSKMLVVEIDGIIHDNQKEYDEGRTAELNRLGFEVIRFTNEELALNLIAVVEKIKSICESRPTSTIGNDAISVVGESQEEYTASHPSPRGNNEVASGSGLRSTMSDQTDVSSSKNANDSYSENSLPSPRGEGSGVRSTMSDKIDVYSSNNASGVRSKHFIEVFTTRPDTIFGVSFLTLAPEHELVSVITTDAQRDAVSAYVELAKNRSERERMADVKRISGEFTGAYVLHPFTGAKIPVWVGDYVLAGYGTGAVMAVPAGDQRDWDFAKHFNLPIPVINDGVDISEAANPTKEAKMINSDFLNGLTGYDALKKAIIAIEERGFGKGKVNYRVRDAGFSRQRYWGEPFPIVYRDGVAYPLSENELPLELPVMADFKPTGQPESPLTKVPEWMNTPEGTRETDTMPGYAGSSWYFLRYMDPQNKARFVGKDAEAYWQDVDLYIGGTEHAVGHLLYARFWQKFLFDRGEVTKHEPFRKLINQGMILGRSNFVYQIVGTSKFISKDMLGEFTNEKILQTHVDVNIVQNDVLNLNAFKAWREENAQAEFILNSEGNYICGVEVEKMSKSKYNVVNPDDIIKEYGADTLRLYEMFLGPLEQFKPWNTNGIEGVFRFLKKLYNLYIDDQGLSKVTDDAPSEAELRILHKTIRKVEEDIEKFSFNTSVSTFMICVNELHDMKCRKREVLKDLSVIIAPYAPHMAEELWLASGGEGSVVDAQFPQWNESFIKESTVAYPVAFNGKVRYQIQVAADMPQAEVQTLALSHEEAARWLPEGGPKKVIVVPGRMVNVVI